MGQRNNAANAQPGTYQPNLGQFPGMNAARQRFGWLAPHDAAQGGAYDPNVSYAQGMVPGQLVNQPASVSRWPQQMQPMQQMQPDWRYQRGGVY